MTLTVIKEIRVGPYKFRQVPVHIFDDEFNVTSYPLMGGIIGNDLLRRFNMIINYPEKPSISNPIPISQKISTIHTQGWAFIRSTGM